MAPAEAATTEAAVKGALEDAGRASNWVHLAEGLRFMVSRADRIYRARRACTVDRGLHSWVPKPFVLNRGLDPKTLGAGLEPDDAPVRVRKSMRNTLPTGGLLLGLGRCAERTSKPKPEDPNPSPGSGDCSTMCPIWCAPRQDKP